MGRVIVVGAGRMTVPITGILASDLAVGTVVKLMEGGTAVEYLVVNQGIPSNSNLYDASCDGTWLLRKDIHSTSKWNANAVNSYANSAVNVWLNGEFFNSLGAVEQKVCEQVKIPYCTGNGDTTINSGANGLPVKVFLLSGYEFGGVAQSTLPIDGAKLSYFDYIASGSAKRIGYFEGNALQWWGRSPNTGNSVAVWYVRVDGGVDNGRVGTNAIYGVRPALILPSTAKFDSTTLILKG